jgi:hypothetical protein
MIGRQKKNWCVQKKGFPLEPRYAGMCTFSTKTFETLTHAIWDTGMYNFIFLPEPSGHHPRFKTYMNPFPCHIANPDKRWGDTLPPAVLPHHSQLRGGKMSILTFLFDRPSSCRNQYIVHFLMWEINKNTPTMVAAVALLLPWCPTPGSEA